VKGIALLVLISVVACGKSSGGGDAGGGSGGAATDGAAGTGGGGGCRGQGMACSASATCCVPLVCAGMCVQPPGQDGGGCSGSAGFGCIFGGCRGDTGTSPVCTNGIWACPTGATDSRTCGGCTGNPPPDYVCADGGWVRADASSN